MKILKRGDKVERERAFVLTCSACKTEIECTTSEMRLQPDPRDGDYYEIACPVCDRPITQAAA